MRLLAAALFAGLALIAVAIFLTRDRIWSDDEPSFEPTFLTTVSVPFVEGKLEHLAVVELEEVGLEVRVERSPNENVEVGRVFDQDPAAGTRVEEGSEVEIHVSAR